MSIYLDNNATSPVRDTVKEALIEGLGIYGNPSAPHRQGQRALMALDEARKKLANLMNVRAEQVVFTSGGTESTVMALTGLCGTKVLENGIQRKKLLLSGVEHAATHETAKFLADSGVDVTLIDVDVNGVIDMEALAQNMSQNGTDSVVSVMVANNETGVCQPIPEIARLCRKNGAILHLDAVQAFGKMPVDAYRGFADAMTLTFHKVGGPKGVGALLLKNELPMQALITGGAQERNRRAGTQPVPLLLGVSALLDGMVHQRDELQHISALKERLEQGIKRLVPHAIIVGEDCHRLCNTTCVILPEFQGETLVMQMDMSGVSISQGSACSSGRVEPSRVLLAQGLTEKQALSAIRISLGWHNTCDDVDTFLEVFAKMGRAAS